jgi:hypothetical protein
MEVERGMEEVGVQHWVARAPVLAARALGIAL